MATPLRVKGYTELMLALSDADQKSQRAVRKVIRQTGDAVKTDAAGRFARYDARSAAGYRTVVRRRGVSVQQSLRKTTGAHPEFGALQMSRALLPAAADKQPETERAMEHALDIIAITFNHGA